MMKKADFERLLDVCCGTLTHEARKSGFSSSIQFENRVRQVLDDLLKGENEMRVDFDSPPQAFPDIAIGEYGVEVKFTLSDTLKSIANSIQESQRVQSVKYIYIVFGKMGGKPEVRWGDYEKSVVHVRTSHVPRFEVELPPKGGGGEGSERSDAPDAGDDFEWSERDAFALRCLNAAAGLYGVVTMEEMARLYNLCAKELEIDVGGEKYADDMEKIADGIVTRLDADDGPIGQRYADECHFCLRNDYRTGELLVTNERLFESDVLPDGTPRTPEEQAKEAKEREKTFDREIAALRDRGARFEMKILPAALFIEYAEPYFFEETPETRALAAFIGDEYGVRAIEAARDAEDIVVDMQKFGATITEAVEFIDESLYWRPKDAAGFERLIRVLGPVASVTRTWEYRGHNASELSRAGLVPSLEKENVPDVFGVLDGDNDDCYGDGDDCDDGEPIDLDELPPAKYTGPVDFKFVKDAEKREKALYDYEGVRIITREFVRDVVVPESTKEERLDAAKRLGFPVDEERGCVCDGNRDMVAGDFATMMDDQHGDPAIKRVLKRKGKLENEYDRAAAEYFENYRYTWLEVLAVKAGVGVKCRDLLTGEELFLMETSFSRGDVKGMTVCAGIAPMGSVYLSLGVISPANFENPATILKIVLTHLGLPVEPPVRLSFADQARFAAETIRRIDANGRFDRMVMG